MWLLGAGLPERRWRGRGYLFAVLGSAYFLMAQSRRPPHPYLEYVPKETVRARERAKAVAAPRPRPRVTAPDLGVAGAVNSHESAMR